MLHFQTAAAGYRLDSQLSAPHRFMTLGSWTCKAGPPSRYRHIHIVVWNCQIDDNFVFWQFQIKTHPLAEVGQAKQPLPQARGEGFWKYVEQGRFLHLESIALYWFAWLLACCLFNWFIWPNAMASAIASDQKKNEQHVYLRDCLLVFLFVSFGRTQWLQPLRRTKKKTGNTACLFFSFLCLFVCVLVRSFVCMCVLFFSPLLLFKTFAFWWSMFR